MRKLKIILLSILMLVSTSCSSYKKYYAYTVYPIGYLLNKIGGSYIETVCIEDGYNVQSTSIRNDYEEVLDESLYLFYINGLEPYYEIYKSDIVDTGVTLVDMSYLNTIYNFKRYTKVTVENKTSYIETDYYTGDAFNNIDINDKDLNIWMDPSMMLSMASRIYSLLAENNVEKASYFKSNYDSLYDQLINVEGEYNTFANELSANNETVKFVSMTASYGNWQKIYGVQVYPVCLSKYGALPTDEQLEIIKQRIIDDGVNYIVYEPNLTDEMYELYDELVEELDLKVVNLSNLSSLSVIQSSEGKDYINIMYENLVALKSMVE